MPNQIRRVRGGLTSEQLAQLPSDVLEARAGYLRETDAEIETLRAIEPPRRLRSLADFN